MISASQYPHGLGFRQMPDSRDHKFTLDRLLAASASRPVATNWGLGEVIDQGATPSCVGHGCKLLLTSEPFKQAGPSPFEIYERARKIDEFPDSVGGTSVRAGLKILKVDGLIESFWWASDTDEMTRYIREFGPMVVGTSWMEGMAFPTHDGWMSVTGTDLGGHCFLIFDADEQTDSFGVANSHGKTWGRGGLARIKRPDFAWLLHHGGVAAAVQEKTRS